LVLDHDRLPHALGELLRDKAREDVVSAAGAEADDDADRLAGKIAQRVALGGGARGERRGEDPRGEPHRATRQRLELPGRLSRAIVAWRAWTRQMRSARRCAAPARRGIIRR